MENNTAQVVLVKDINPGSDNYGYLDDSYPTYLTEFEDKLYFSADNGDSGQELFVSDGTAEGTQLLVDLNPGINESYYSEYPNTSYPSDLTVFEDKLYFAADDGENGRELFVSDGTAEGTQLLVDLNPGVSESYYGDGYFPNSSYPSDFTEFEDKLYFAADNEENGRELWVSDGTAEGTQLLVDLNPGVSESYYGGGYFTNSSAPRNFTEFEDKLYFTADNGDSGRELFVSDGTAEGTQLLVDLNPGFNEERQGNYPNSSYPYDLTEFEGKLYFSADDGENGSELWVSDGTAEGTQLLVDLNPGFSYGFGDSSNPSGFTEFEGKLYFSANDGENGNELWVSDGTVEGTQLLVDINPGFSYGYYSDYPNSSYPFGFTEFEGKLYFNANNGDSGEELFVSDGTAEGTQLLLDLNPGFGNYGYPNGSQPRDLTVFGDELFFSADNGETGRELYKLTFDEDDNPLLTGTNDADRLTGGDMADQISGLDGKDTLDGADGNDTLIGGKGADILLGSNGKDNLDGGNGNDTLIGGNGVDILLGGNGKDNLDGGNGDDTLIGGDGNDILLGGNGKDNLDGGNGNDTLIGGDGVDVFILSGKGTDTVVDFQSGSDRLNLAEDLEFHHLSFAGDEITVGEKLLVTLDDINSEHLTVDDFTMI